MPAKPIALACSDIHLSLTPPPARAGEPDWLDAQARTLMQVRTISESFKGAPLPIIYAGDIFDKWNVVPELVNFAILNLPKGWAIPGQHDLPHHEYDAIHKSAYWSLVLAGTIKDIGNPDTNVVILGEAGIVLHPFPWGFGIIPNKIPPSKGLVHIAVIHKYIWMDKRGYVGAPKESHITDMVKALQGYDAAVSGDNHKAWDTIIRTKLYPDHIPFSNCGCLIRRKSDETDPPRVSLIMDDGSIQIQELDTSKDVFEPVDNDDEVEPEINSEDLDAFLKELRPLWKEGVRFKDAVSRFMVDNKVVDKTAKIIRQALGM